MRSDNLGPCSARTHRGVSDSLQTTATMIDCVLVKFDISARARDGGLRTRLIRNADEPEPPYSFACCTALVGVVVCTQKVGNDD